MAHNIIGNGHVENDFIEYKKSDTFKDKILKTVCAYANNYMNREIGLLFIGIEEVDDRATGDKAIPKRPITGVQESKIESTENSLKRLIAEVKPKPCVQFVYDKIDDKIYIVLAVEPGSEGPYETSEKAEHNKEIGLKAGRYIRVRRDTRIPNKREEFELLKKFANYSFTSSLNETATIDDLNYEYMKEYLVRTHAREDIRRLSKLDMARHMGLVTESEYRGYRAKNFAVLMFADRPQDFIPYARVEIIREAKGTDKMESKVFDGPIWLQTQQVRNYFRDEIMASYTIRAAGQDGHRIIYNWPEVMFDELSTNCILHKEYDKPQYVGIYVYADHICFINHNRPLPPVTIEDMNEKREFIDRKYLNPEIKEMFFALDLIESYGSGIRRAKDAMSENGSPQLVFGPDNDVDDYTMVTAYINNEFTDILHNDETKRSFGSNDPNHDLNDDPNRAENEKANIIEMRRRHILEILQEDGNITRNALSQKLGVSEATIKRDFDALKNAGKIRRIGGTRGKWEIL